MDKSVDSMQLSNTAMRQKLIDSTSQSAHTGARSLFAHGTAGHELQLVSRFKVKLVSMHFAEVGPEWGSQGELESDFMHHIDIALSGHRQVVSADGQVIEIAPGTIHFWPGNTPLERRCGERCEVLFLKLRCEWLPGVDPLLDWPERHPQRVGTCSADEWKSWHSPGVVMDAQTLFKLQAQLQLWMSAVLTDIGGMIDRHLKTHAPFAAAFELAEGSPGADLRVEALAEACGKGTDAFARAFTRSTGISPKEFLNRRLNQEAIHLVVNTDLRMKEIADRLRFSDEFYFSRFFHKQNEISPSSYRLRFRSETGRSG